MNENKTALNNQIFCVLFPGIVKNEEKAIQCLGGTRTISQMFAQQNKKPLQLSFQPDNPFVKKINGEKKSTSGVLLKVKIKKVVNEDKTVKKREVIETSALSYVKKIFKFDAMCDFQYLPVSTVGSKPQCILEDVVPLGLNDLDILEKPAPLFVLPAGFARFEKPVGYAYTDRKSNINKEDEVPLNPGDNDDVHKTRMDRGKPLSVYRFNLENTLPTEPNEFFTKAIEAKIATNPPFKEEYETIKKMFDERPVWSMNLIKHLTKIKEINLKIIVPGLAIYYRTGPWRLLWVRFGFDPRKNPDARFYQTLDFRLRHTVLTREARKELELRKSTLEVINSDEVVPEAAVFFKPGTVPPQRQIFYQYHDVHLSEVQEIINKTPPPGYMCHPKWGWLPPTSADTGREIIIKHIMQAVLGDKQAELKFEEASSDSVSESDDDEVNRTDVSAMEIDTTLTA